MKMVAAVMHLTTRPTASTRSPRRAFRTTRLDSHGGFLQKGNATLLCGVSEEQVDTVLRIVRQHSKSRTEFLSPMPLLVEPGDFFVRGIPR